MNAALKSKPRGFADGETHHVEIQDHIDTDAVDFCPECLSFVYFLSQALPFQAEYTPTANYRYRRRLQDH